MLKKPIAFLLVSSLLIFSNQAYSYFNDEDRFKNNNTYTQENSFNFNNTSYLSDFSLDVNLRSDFFQNPMYSSTLDMWSKNDDYQDRIDSQVAPNFNISDYAGYVVSNNIKWENYSSVTDSYETQLYTNVVTCHPERSEGSYQYTSLDILTTRGDWTITDTINNIGYDSNNNISNFSVSTLDIASNELKQDISNIKYQKGNQIKAFEDFKNLCQSKIDSGNTFGFNSALNILENQTPPPSTFPLSFDLTLTNPKGNITTISFNNLDWDKNNLISFDASISSPEGMIKKIKIDNVINQDGITSLNINSANKLIEYDSNRMSIEDLKNKLGDIGTAINILGSSKIQLEDNKLVYLSANLSDDGYLENNSRGYNINYDITNKENVSNLYKRDLHILEQTDKKTTRSVLWYDDVDKMSEQNLIQRVENARSKIENNLNNLENTTTIETTWGDKLQTNNSFDLKLDNNRIKSDSMFQTEQGHTLKDVTFIVKNDKLKAVQGTDQNNKEYGINFFNKPVVRKETEIVITPKLQKEMTKNVTHGLGYRTNEEIKTQRNYEIELAKRYGKTGYIVLCFNDNTTAKIIRAGQLSKFGEKKTDIINKSKHIEVIANRHLNPKKEMIPIHTEILQRDKDGKMYTIGVPFEGGIRKMSVENLQNHYKDIEILRHESWTDPKLVNDKIQAKIESDQTGLLKTPSELKYDYGRLIGHGDDKNRGISKEICSELVYHIGRDISEYKKKVLKSVFPVFGNVKYDNLVSPLDLYKARDSWDDNIREINNWRY